MEAIGDDVLWAAPVLNRWTPGKGNGGVGGARDDL